MTDIVERLRSPRMTLGLVDGRRAVLADAADTITRLRDEVAELRARLDYRTELLERTREAL